MAPTGKARRLAGLLAVFLSALVVSGCAGRFRCEAPETDPVSLYAMGMELAWDGDVEAAGDKLSRALACDKKFSPAQGGLAVVAAISSTEARGGNLGEIDRRRAFDLLRLAGEYASGGEEEFAFRVASMRVYTELKPRRWLLHVKDDYKKAMRTRLDEELLPFYQTWEAASYFMGTAYLDAGEFEAAGDVFSEVIASRRSGRWSGPAGRGLKRAEEQTR